MGVGSFRNNSSAHWLWRLTLAQGLCIHCLNSQSSPAVTAEEAVSREAPGHTAGDPSVWGLCSILSAPQACPRSVHRAVYQFDHKMRRHRVLFYLKA